MARQQSHIIGSGAVLHFLGVCGVPTPSHRVHAQAQTTKLTTIPAGLQAVVVCD